MAVLRSSRLAMGKLIGPGVLPADGYPQGTFPEGPPRNISTTTVYTVPAGHRAILREAIFYCPAAAPIGTDVVLSVNSGGVICRLYSVKSTSVGVFLNLKYNTVLNPGDLLTIFASYDQVDYVLSGAVLPIQQ